MQLLDLTPVEFSQKYRQQILQQESDAILTVFDIDNIIVKFIYDESEACVYAYINDCIKAISRHGQPFTKLDLNLLRS